VAEINLFPVSRKPDVTKQGIYITIAAAAGVVAAIDYFVIFPLATSPTLFDSIGRAVAAYAPGALVIWAGISFFRPDEAAGFWEVVAGSILAGFLGMVLALLPGLGLAEIVDLVKCFFLVRRLHRGRLSASAALGHPRMKRINIEHGRA